MNSIRLAWEPKNLTPLATIEDRFRFYMRGKAGGVSLLSNGTLYFSRDEKSHEAQTRQAMERARVLIDFLVVPLKEGGFLARFDADIAVFVSAEEYEGVREELKDRKIELMFPQEEMLGKANNPHEHLLI